MKNFSFLYLLGITFWSLIALIASYTILIPSKKNENLSYYLPIVLKNSEGIKIGTRVNVLGVDQGYVRYLDYYPVDREGNVININECEDLCKDKMYDQILLVVLNLRKQIELYKNYKLYTRYDRIIGEKVIEINPGSKIQIKNTQEEIYPELETMYLNSNDVLKVITGNSISLNINHLIKATNYEDPLTLLSHIIYENRKPLYRIFKNLAEITQKIDSGNGTISLLLNENQLLTETDKVILEAILLVRDLREGLESVRENNILIKTGSGILNLF